MAYNITTTFKSPIESGGRGGRDGIGVSNKVMISGRINITSYTATGEVILPSDFGLRNIDSIYFNAESFNNAATKLLAATIGRVGYNTGLSKVVIATTGTTANTTSQAAVVRFLAIGDDGTVGNLL